MFRYVLLAPGILMLLGEFWEVCAPLVWASENIVQLTVNDRTLVLLWCGTEAKLFLSFFIYIIETGDL